MITYQPSKAKREAYHLNQAVNAMGALRTQLSRCEGQTALISSLGDTGDDLLRMYYAAMQALSPTERAEVDQAIFAHYQPYETPFGTK
jgi:hypothetical protein